MAYIRQRVKEGSLTERSLARSTGISQPHLHNALKGVRSLSAGYADLLLVHLNLQISDLVSYSEIEINSSQRLEKTLVYIPRLRGAAGPGLRVEQAVEAGEECWITTSSVSRFQNAVLITLAHDPQLYPYFQAGDTALILRLEASAASLEPDSVYMVQTQTATLLRYLRMRGNRLYLVTPGTESNQRKWRSLSLLNHKLTELIEGRVVWIGRNFKFPEIDSGIQLAGWPPADSR